MDLRVLCIPIFDCGTKIANTHAAFNPSPCAIEKSGNNLISINIFIRINDYVL